ncbi:MAG: hypothetical protein WC769_01535 [Thermodesulfovibrionales bacterium]|jgi:hypothetical protein
MKIRITKNTILGFRIVNKNEIYEVPADISNDELKQLKDLGNVEEIKKDKTTKGLPSKPSGPLTYEFNEALKLIAGATTIAEIEEVIEGDTRTAVLEVAGLRTKELEAELDKESQG